MSKSRLADRAFLLVRITVSAALLVIVISKLGISDKSLSFFARFAGNVSAIVSKIGSIPYGLIAAGIALFAFSMSCVMLRWFILLKSMGFRIKCTAVIKYSLIGYLFNNIMPSTIGGDIIKGYYVHRDARGSKEKAIFTIFMDRTVGALATLVFVLAGSIYLQRTVPSIRILTFFMVAFFAVLAAAAFFLDEKYLMKLKFYRKLPGEHLLKRLHRAFFFYKREGLKSFLLALFVSFFLQVSIVTINYLLITKLSGRHIPYPVFVCVVPLINVIQGLPISFAGWGIGEAAYSVAFTTMSVSAATAVTVSLFNKFMMFLAGLAGLPFYIANRASELVHEREPQPSS